MEENNTKQEDFDSVYGAHASQGDYVNDHVADEMMEQLIASMCGDMTCVPANSKQQKLAVYSIEYLVDNLPAVNFVVSFYTQLIIGAGLEAKDPYNQKKLDEWLQKKNAMGQTNQDIIADSVKNSLMYGYSGIRLSLGDFYSVMPQQLRIWKLPLTTQVNGRVEVIPGLKSLAFYEVNLDKGFKVEKDETERTFVLNGNKYTLEEVIKQKMLKVAADGSYIIA